MKRILVINSKGGSGKTTLATTLASYYAQAGYETALTDYDPQGSSMQWLKLRPAQFTKIQGANGAKAKGNSIRSWQMVIPQSTAYVIIDAPAGADGILLQELVQRADNIIVPVAPSPVDIHATSDFIRDLFLIGKIRQHKTSLAVVANRIRSNRPLYQPLEKFLSSLSIPFITAINDTDNFVHAMGAGIGIFEMDGQHTQTERTQLQPLIDWLADSSENGVVASLCERRKRNQTAGN